MIKSLTRCFSYIDTQTQKPEANDSENRYPCLGSRNVFEPEKKPVCTGNLTFIEGLFENEVYATLLLLAFL